jgi:hypothetical protein
MFTVLTPETLADTHATVVVVVDVVVVVVVGGSVVVVVVVEVVVVEVVVVGGSVVVVVVVEVVVVGGSVVVVEVVEVVVVVGATVAAGASVVVINVVLDDKVLALGRTVVVELAVRAAATVDVTGTAEVEIDTTAVDVGKGVVSAFAGVVDVVGIAAETRSLTLGSSGFVEVTSNTSGGCDSTWFKTVGTMTGALVSLPCTET